MELSWKSFGVTPKRLVITAAICAAMMAVGLTAWASRSDASTSNACQYSKVYTAAGGVHGDARLRLDVTDDGMFVSWGGVVNGDRVDDWTKITVHVQGEPTVSMSNPMWNTNAVVTDDSINTTGPISSVVLCGASFSSSSSAAVQAALAKAAAARAAAAKARLEGVYKACLAKARLLLVPPGSCHPPA